MRYHEYPKVRIILDDLGDLMHIVAELTTNGRHLVRAFCHLMQTQPEVSSYDSIWHLLEFEGDATNDDVLQMERAYRAAATPDARLAYTCVVTRDPCMSYWAIAIDEQIPERRHLVMYSVDQAMAWLDQIRRRCPEPNSQRRSAH